MRVLALATGAGLAANATAARLKRLAIGAGRDLAKFAGGGQPNLDVVSFRRSEAHVAGGKLHDAIVQAEFLQERLRVTHKRFQFGVALIGPRELEQLDLLEL